MPPETNRWAAPVCRGAWLRMLAGPVGVASALVGLAVVLPTGCAAKRGGARAPAETAAPEAPAAEFDAAAAPAGDDLDALVARLDAYEARLGRLSRRGGGDVAEARAAEAPAGAPAETEVAADAAPRRAAARRDGARKEAAPRDRCSQVCELADAICDLSDRICGLAARHAGEDRYEAACRRAEDDCDRARDACTECSPGEP